MQLIFNVIFLIFAELVYFKIANHFNIIDKPNERSSHTRITLRGGGVIFFIAILLYFLFNDFQYPWFFTGLTLITAISFADDIRPQSNKIRLIIHFISMGLLFYQWGLSHLPWQFTLVAFIVSTGIINAYNFMDGINGITGAYSLVLAVVFWYINNYIITFVDNELLLILISSILIFNFFNFRTKAICFAGDVGAISVAFILVFLLGQLVLKASDFSYIILLVVYGVDSVLTIIHRLILKENIFHGHRKHVFQIMANELKIPHVLVSSIYAILQLLIAIGYFYFQNNSYLYLLVVSIVLTIAYVVFKIKYYKLHKG